MTRQNIVFCLVLLLTVAVPAFVLAKEAKISEEETIGGLTCFTIAPELSREKEPEPCAKLCAQQGAACSGVTSPMSPPKTCESPSGFVTCRCCKVEK